MSSRNSEQLDETLRAAENKMQELSVNTDTTIKEIKAEVIQTVRDNTVLLDSIRELLRSKIEESYNDNKAFQKEFVAALASRLTKQDSDILVQIRDTGNESKSAVAKTLEDNQKFAESRIENYQNAMEILLKTAFEKQAKQTFIVKMIAIGFITLTLVITIKLFIYV